MARRSQAARLTDIIEASERVRATVLGMSLQQFKADWRTRWAVERGIEIVSEASRHLTPDLKARHPDIDWPRVAGIGNILRHEYQRTAYDVLWHVAAYELLPLETVCSEELAAEQASDQET